MKNSLKISLLLIFTNGIYCYAQQRDVVCRLEDVPEGWAVTDYRENRNKCCNLFETCTIYDVINLKGLDRLEVCYTTNIPKNWEIVTKYNCPGNCCGGSKISYIIQKKNIIPPNNPSAKPTIPLSNPTPNPVEYSYIKSIKTGNQDGTKPSQVRFGKIRLFTSESICSDHVSLFVYKSPNNKSNYSASDYFNYVNRLNASEYDLPSEGLEFNRFNLSNESNLEAYGRTPFPEGEYDFYLIDRVCKKSYYYKINIKKGDEKDINLQVEIPEPLRSNDLPFRINNRFFPVRIDNVENTEGGRSARSNIYNKTINYNGGIPRTTPKYFNYTSQLTCYVNKPFYGSKIDIYIALENSPNNFKLLGSLNAHFSGGVVPECGEAGSLRIINIPAGSYILKGVMTKGSNTKESSANLILKPSKCHSLQFNASIIDDYTR
jgi:hypothetical protein